MDDSQQAPLSNQSGQNINISPSGSKEGEAVLVNSADLENNLEQVALVEPEPQPETVLQKIEEAPAQNSFSNSQPNPSAQNQPAILATDDKNLEFPISLEEALKITKGYFLFKDPSDPLLWIALLVIKNFGKNKE